MKIETIEDVFAYIDQHCRLMGFNPTAVGVTSECYEYLCRQMHGMKIYRSEDDLVEEMFQKEIYVNKVRVIVNRHMGTFLT